MCPYEPVRELLGLDAGPSSAHNTPLIGQPSISIRCGLDEDWQVVEIATAGIGVDMCKNAEGPYEYDRDFCDLTFSSPRYLSGAAFNVKISMPPDAKGRFLEIVCLRCEYTPHRFQFPLTALEISVGRVLHHRIRVDRRETYERWTEI